MGGGGSTQIKDSASQKALASIAARRFNLYQQYYVPLENQYMSDVFAMMEPESFKTVEGFVNAVQQPQFQKARRQMQQAAFSQGVDPTSGRYQDYRARCAGGLHEARHGLSAAIQLRGTSPRPHSGGARKNPPYHAYGLSCDRSTGSSPRQIARPPITAELHS